MKTVENGANTSTNVNSVYTYFDSIKKDHAALRQFFTHMPKGGDLHNHLTGSAYAETYFELAAKNRMYVDMETGKLYKEAPKDIETIQLSQEMGDLHNHRMALIDKWSIRNFHPYKYPLGPDEYFFGTFGLLSALTGDMNNLAYLVYDLKVRASKEKVQYLEVMGTSPDVPDKCFLGNDYDKYAEKLKKMAESGDYNNLNKVLKEILVYFDDNAETNTLDYLDSIHEIDKLSNDHFDKRLSWEPIGVTMKYQGYASRGGEPLKVFAQLYLVHNAIQIEKENRDGRYNSQLLVGCNIVAAEDGEKSMFYYRLHMEMFAVLNEKFPDVPTSLHAGELTMGLMRPEHMGYHISQAVQNAKANRIGHGVDLPFEWDSKYILSLMKNIAIEINLTSNEFILGVKDSEHPVMLYFKAGVPIVISTDDPGILRTSLTEQYTLAVLRYGFSYKEIKSFVLNSIKHSFLSDREKSDQLEKLNKSLSDFEGTYNSAT
ncbi:hypothetical protein [Parabacteroides sp.]